MSYHEAPQQMAGYLYQVVQSLLLLLDSDDPSYSICIEKFDDIAFIENGSPKDLIQVKHHKNRQGNLSDLSVDLWRSISSWCDAIRNYDLDIVSTNFIIITTASATNDSIAWYLSQNQKQRNVDTAIKKIQTITKKKSNVVQKFIDNFQSLSKIQQEQLISQIFIIDNSCKLIDYRTELKKRLRLGTLPKYLESICDELEGWWFQKAISFLCEEDVNCIKQREVQAKLYDIFQSYQDDNLPITIDSNISPTAEEIRELGMDTRIFLEQLKLICLTDKRMQLALKDYYNAYRQKAMWIREELLYVNDLENYEKRLIDEWERLFEISKEHLERFNKDEQRRIEEGRELYNKIQDLDIKIKDRVSSPFIMRGSYQQLSNELKVGWHVDFYKRLYNLLRGGKNEKLG